MIIREFAPVLIPALNRYEHLKKCLSSLAKNSHALDTVLYIALDAPAREGHKDGYNKIVKYLNKISGFKKVIVIKRDKNFGVPGNVWKAQDYLFKKHDAIIVSEDDNYFSPNFLDYMNKGLQIFKNRKDIFAICGYNYPINIPLNYPYNFYLFRGAPGWGIGLWKNKHKNKDISVKSVKEFLKSYKNILNIIKKANYLLPHLFDMINKNLIAGDTAYSMNLVKNNMFCILPTISKVRNYGHDGSGVHCGSTRKDVFKDQLIDNARYFDFSVPVNKVMENKELNSAVQKRLGVSPPETFKRGLIFFARGTNLHEYYKKLRDIIKSV